MHRLGGRQQLGREETLGPARVEDLLVIVGLRRGRRAARGMAAGAQAGRGRPRRRRRRYQTRQVADCSFRDRHERVCRLREQLRRHPWAGQVRRGADHLLLTILSFFSARCDYLCGILELIFFL